MPKPHPLTLLGATIALTACASVPQSQQSFTTQQKTVASPPSTLKHRPIKRYNDGSTPFTMQEIEERLLKVFALPPEKINKATVEQAFGVELSDSEAPTFYEKISEEDQMAFTISALTPVGFAHVLRYRMLQKGEKDGELRHLSNPKELPDAYKIPYIPFAKKLEERGWKMVGRNYSAARSTFRNYFEKKKGYLMSVRIDKYKVENNEIDHSHSKISSIVISTTHELNK